MYRESVSDMLMGHYAALAENSTEQPRPVRHDAVDSEIEEHGHAWRVVDGPDVYRKTRTMCRADETRVDDGHAAPAKWHLHAIRLRARHAPGT